MCNKYEKYIRDYQLTAERTFTTYQQQIKKLKGRNLKFDKINEAQAVSILERNYYYKIVNGYKEYFIDENNSSDDYLSVDFRELLSLYIFDEELRTILFKSLMKFECEFKSVLSYVFMENHTPYGYMDLKNFSNVVIKNNKSLSDVIGEIINYILEPETKRRKKTIQHFFDKNEVVPFYALVGALSFGTINNFYKYMLHSEQCEIVRHFNLKDIKAFSQILNRLNTLRNICAHSERLFSYKFEYNEGKTVIKFFDVINKYKYLSTTEEIKNIEINIIDLLKSLKKQINQKAFEKVKTEMGIPKI